MEKGGRKASARVTDVRQTNAIAGFRMEGAMSHGVQAGKGKKVDSSLEPLMWRKIIGFYSSAAEPGRSFSALFPSLSPMYKSPKGSDFLVIFLLGLLGLREQVYTWSSLRSQRKRPHQDLFPEQPLADPGKVRVRSSRKESVSSGGERHHVYSQLFRKPWITLVQSSCPVTCGPQTHIGSTGLTGWCVFALIKYVEII